jgi:hypothetical protein
LVGAEHIPTLTGREEDVLEAVGQVRVVGCDPGGEDRHERQEDQDATGGEGQAIASEALEEAAATGLPRFGRQWIVVGDLHRVGSEVAHSGLTFGLSQA